MDLANNKPLIYIGADHGGFELKQFLVGWLLRQGSQVEDVGAAQLDPSDDYPQFASAVAVKIQATADSSVQDPSRFGLLICRSGAGMSIVANKYQGVRAVVCRSLEEVRLARAHNNANVLVLEGDVISQADSCLFIESFFATPYEGGRHDRRLEQFVNLGEAVSGLAKIEVSGSQSA